MKKILIVLSILIVNICISNSQVSLTYINHYQITPNAQDTIGAFCRTFYNETNHKFYTVYAGRMAGSPAPQGQLHYFAWREYDSNFVFTGLHGRLSNHSGAGDFVMHFFEGYYYHLTSYFDSASNQFYYKLSKYDANFNLINSVSMLLDDHDSIADQIMNIANNRIIIGSLHENSVIHPKMPMMTPFWRPTMHKFEYDLSLNQAAGDIHLNETFYSWGGSCIYNNNRYYIITQDSFPLYNLNAYEFDNSWNYIGYTTLTNDGQWSQGVIIDNNNYYVAYHSGHEHRAGNISIGVFNSSWSNIYATTITNYSNYPPPAGTNYNANRPYLTKVNDKLYISYDVDRYNYQPPFIHENRWQSHVMIYKIEETIGINNQETTVPGNDFNIYPNPTNGAFVLQTDVTGNVEIYNSLGEAVYSGSVSSGVNNIDINRFSSGVHFVKMKTGESFSYKKLIIVK